MSQFFHSNSLE